jgi:hypothetical protein
VKNKLKELTDAKTPAAALIVESVQVSGVELNKKC